MIWKKQAPVEKFTNHTPWAPWSSACSLTMGSLVKCMFAWSSACSVKFLTSGILRMGTVGSYRVSQSIARQIVGYVLGMLFCTLTDSPTQER